MGAEDFLQRLDGKFGEGMELAVPGEEAVGNERVDVGMKIEVFAKGVEGENDGWMRLGFTECRTEIKGEALMGCGAEMFEERTVPLEISAEHLRQGEDVVPVGDWSENAGDEEFGAGLDIFLVAGRAEPAAFTGKSQESIEAAGVAMDSSEAAFEIPAIEEFMDDSLDNGTQRALFGLVMLGITLAELSVMAVSALPKR